MDANTTTAEILPPRTLSELEETIGSKPITWGQFTFLMDYVARQTGDKSMRLLSRMCDDIVHTKADDLDS